MCNLTWHLTCYLHFQNEVSVSQVSRYSVSKSIKSFYFYMFERNTFCTLYFITFVFCTLYTCTSYVYDPIYLKIHEMITPSHPAWHMPERLLSEGGLLWYMYVFISSFIFALQVPVYKHFTVLKTVQKTLTTYYKSTWYHQSNRTADFQTYHHRKSFQSKYHGYGLSYNLYCY